MCNDKLCAQGLALYSLNQTTHTNLFEETLVAKWRLRVRRLQLQFCRREQLEELVLFYSVVPKRNKRSSAKATAGAMSPFDLQDVNMFLLIGKCYEGY